jgi:ribonucleoside-diphosphate reductase alpha chain
MNSLLTKRALGLPDWIENNPYLEILAPRFFDNQNTVDWSDLPRRVRRLFLEVELKYSDQATASNLADVVEELVREGAFLPNSPVMMNSESESNVNLFACHVLAPPKDLSDLNVAKQIHDGCGGIGYDFSLLDDPVRATINIEEQTALLNPNRKRKAHSAVTVDYKHPMIFEFIKLSNKLSITHTNIELDDEFFTNLQKEDDQALKLWNALCLSITEQGRPSISFASAKKKRSSIKLINNVCGESLLRENESALIGSINLTKFVDEGDFDFLRFEKVARLGLRFLDNLHDIQSHASEIVQARCLESRKVGTGLMGFSDALLLLDIRYGSEESFAFISKLMGIYRETLIDESEKLGQERGFCNTDLLPVGTKPRRNASLMSIPANGTLSLIANVSGGIEPIFTCLMKQMVQGDTIYQLQPTFRQLLKNNSIDVDFVFNELMSGKDIRSISEIPGNIQEILVLANELEPVDHIKTQALFQSFIDGGISKTINLPNSATQEDIASAILLANDKGCVGLSLYRNGSLKDQPTQMVNQ